MTLAPRYVAIVGVLLLCAAQRVRGEVPISPTPARSIVLRTDIDPIRSEAVLRLTQESDSGATATTSVLLYNPSTGGAACWVLPASSWQARFSRYIYNDRTLAFGPVKRARWTHGRLIMFLSSANPSQPLDYPLVAGQQHEVALILTSSTPQGEVRECYLFDPANATITVDRPGPDGVFKAFDAAAPAPCPDPSMMCPP